MNDTNYKLSESLFFSLNLQHPFNVFGHIHFSLISIIFCASERGTLLKRGYVIIYSKRPTAPQDGYPSLQGEDNGITNGEITHVVILISKIIAWLKAVYSQLSSLEAGYYTIWGLG